MHRIHCNICSLGLSNLISIFVLVNIYHSENYCNSITLDAKIDDHNLLLYSSGCQTKVYQLFSDTPCNCRFFQITKDDTLNVCIHVKSSLATITTQSELLTL